jgi:molybdopterin biosynthesis enzyme
MGPQDYWRLRRHRCDRNNGNKRPLVSIISTGDEIVPASLLKPDMSRHQFYVISGMVTEAGCVRWGMGYIKTSKDWWP